jgi:hypothetical protein
VVAMYNGGCDGVTSVTLVDCAADWGITIKERATSVNIPI